MLDIYVSLSYGPPDMQVYDYESKLNKYMQ